MASTVTITIPDFRVAPDELVARALPMRDGRWSRQTKELMARFGSDRLDLNDAWASTWTDWTCPCCLRKKSQIVRLTPSGVLLCRIEYHHDHVRDRAKRIIRAKNPRSEDRDTQVSNLAATENVANLVERFSGVLLCIDCNLADGVAKNQLQGVVDPDFTFTPSEISSFTKARSNMPHEIDSGVAAAIWESVRDDFEQRVAFAELLADRIARRLHHKRAPQGSAWLRPLRDADIIHDLVCAHAGPDYRPYRRAGDLDARARSAAGAGSSLSKRSRRGPTPPSEAEFNRLDQERSAQYPTWRDAAPDWTCAVCGRSKREIVRKSNRGAWTAHIHKVYEYQEERDADRRWFREAFYGSTGRLFGAHAAVLICHDCRNIIAETMRRSPGLSDECLMVDELRSVVTAVTFNAKHEVDESLADQIARDQGARSEAVADYWRFHRHLEGAAASYNQSVGKCGETPANAMDILAQRHVLEHGWSLEDAREHCRWLLRFAGTPA